MRRVLTVAPAATLAGGGNGLEPAAPPVLVQQDQAVEVGAEASGHAGDPGRFQRGASRQRVGQREAEAGVLLIDRSLVAADRDTTPGAEAGIDREPRTSLEHVGHAALDGIKRGYDFRGLKPNVAPIHKTPGAITWPARAD